MKQDQILEIFKKNDAILQGHFLLSSGLHSSQYLQCAKVLEKPAISEKICKILANKFKDKKPDVILAPAIGGIIVSYEVARALGKRGIFAERINGKMTLRRGFILQKKEKVLVVEDVITTGLSTNETVNIVRENGAILIGVGCIVDRASKPISFGCDFISLLKIDIPTFNPADCPLCQKGVPVNKPGSRSINT